MKEETISLVKYRIQGALDCLEEAKILLNEDKTRGAINRIYYSMFYAVLALLATRELGASKHAGVISMFHREFVKTGVFPKEIAKYIDIAFDLRTKGDYRDFVEFEKEEVSELLSNAVLFIRKAEELTDNFISKDKKQ